MVGETRRLSQIVLMCCDHNEVVGDMHTPIGELAASSLGDDIFATGGMNAEGFLTADCHRIYSGFHVARSAPLPMPRGRHASTTDSPNGRIFVAGGVIAQPNGVLSIADDVLAYDATADVWEKVCELPLPTSRCVVEIVGSKLFVIGGDTGTNTRPGRPLYPALVRPDVQILDLLTMKWSFGKSKPVPETGVTSAVMGDEIFVVSSDPVGGRVDSLVEVYNTVTDSWRRIPDMPTKRTDVPCGFVDGKLICVNGQDNDNRSLNVKEVFDPKLNNWTSVRAETVGCWRPGYTTINERLVLVGGTSAS